MRTARHLIIVGFACAAAVGLIACGDDDKDSAATTTTAAPESRLASDAEVASGLKDLVTVAKGVSQESDETASKKASGGLEPVWMKVEGTVKKNDPDSYATIEEDLSLLESGDQKKTRTGASEMAKIVDGYLAKYPG
jgi:hypothetical protein